MLFELFRATAQHLSTLVAILLAPLQMAQLEVFSHLWDLNWRTKWLIVAWACSAVWTLFALTAGLRASASFNRLLHHTGWGSSIQTAAVTGVAMHWGRAQMITWHLGIENFDTYQSFGNLGPGYQVSRYAWAGSGYVLACAAGAMLFIQRRCTQWAPRSLPLELTLWLAIVAGIISTQRLIDTQLPLCWGAGGPGNVPERLFWRFEDADSTLRMWSSAVPAVSLLLLLWRFGLPSRIDSPSRVRWGPPTPLWKGTLLLSTGALAFASSRNHAHDARTPIPYDALDQSYCTANTPVAALPPAKSHLPNGTITVHDQENGLLVRGYEGGSVGDLEADLRHQIHVAEIYFDERPDIPLTLVANQSEQLANFAPLLQTRIGARQPLQLYVQRPKQKWSSAVLGSLPRSPKCARLKVNRRALLKALDDGQTWVEFLRNRRLDE